MKKDLPLLQCWKQLILKVIINTLTDTRIKSIQIVFKNTEF